MKTLLFIICIIITTSLCFAGGTRSWTSTDNQGNTTIIRQRGFTETPVYDWQSTNGDSGVIRQREYTETPTYDRHDNRGNHSVIRENRRHEHPDYRQNKPKTLDEYYRD